LPQDGVPLPIAACIMLTLLFTDVHGRPGQVGPEPAFRVDGALLQDSRGALIATLTAGQWILAGSQAAVGRFNVDRAALIGFEHPGRTAYPLGKHDRVVLAGNTLWAGWPVVVLVTFDARSGLWHSADGRQWSTVTIDTP
jgi:hypothetical protein